MRKLKKRKMQQVSGKKRKGLLKTNTVKILNVDLEHENNYSINGNYKVVTVIWQ